MRNLSIPFLFLVGTSTCVLACSFQMGSKKDPNAPQAASTATPTPSTTPTPAPRPTVATLGKRGTPAAGGVQPVLTPTGTAAPTTTAPPAGIPVLAGTSTFGQGTPDVSGWKGSFYVLSPATQKLPALASMTPNGVLFAKELNVALKPMTGGFPGIDATRNEDFAIRWEAPLVVDNEADYTFRIVSDDGSVVLIDGTKIVDNDGQHTAKEASGPVHLVKGTHVITVDYFQAAGPVQLQLFCKKAGGTETICPTRL